MDTFYNTDPENAPFFKRGYRRLFLAYGLFSLVVLAVLAACFALKLDTLSAGYSRPLRLVQLGLVTVLSFGFLASLRHVQTRLPSFRISRSSSIMFGAACALAGLLAAALVATVVLQSVPLSGDEGAYLYQADLFSHGRLWAQLTPVQRYISQSFIFPIGNKLVSQYPPGWPAVLAAAQTVGFPMALVNPAIGALTIVAIFRFAAIRHGPEVALLTASIMTVSAFFLFNSASFLNEGIVALFAILFVGSASSFIDRPGVRAAIAAGFWLSAIAFVRHFDAILFAAPVAIVLLRRGTVWHWKLAPLAAAASVPLFALLLYYYGQITGNPLVVPQTLRNPSDGLLGPNWHVVHATEILLGRLVELAEWISPPFVVALAWSLLHKLHRGEMQFYDLYGPLFLAGYWLYWSEGGLRWGPRYIYPALPFMALLVAKRAWHALRNGHSRHDTAFVHLVLISTLVSLLQVPFLAARARELISQTQDIYRQVRDAGIHNAVVIAVSGTGVIWHLDGVDLARNGLTPLDRDVVYAHGPHPLSARIAPADVEPTVRALRAYFPARKIWLYQRDEAAIHGKLVEAGHPAIP
jgi:hypothetical protein